MEDLINVGVGVGVSLIILICLFSCKLLLDLFMTLISYLKYNR